MATFFEVPAFPVKQFLSSGARFCSSRARFGWSWTPGTPGQGLGRVLELVGSSRARDPRKAFRALSDNSRTLGQTDRLGKVYSGVHPVSSMLTAWLCCGNG